MLVDGRRVVRPPREVALVFQDYSRSLFPWLTVIRNVMFPLHGVGLRKAERVERASAVLAEMGLDDVSHKYPWELSGGMQQRVAIARALVSRPEILLLDEPFASVDALTRAELQDVLLRVHGTREGRPVTIVHVTHDIDEAVYLADRVLVFSRAPGGSWGRSRSVSRAHGRSGRPAARPRFLACRDELHALIGSQQALR